jgi:hypothetical protein
MANAPEITLKFNADTDGLSSALKEVLEKIDKLRKRREVKGDSFTNEEVKQLNELLELYDKYERKTKGINEQIRRINATEFGSMSKVDDVLDNTEKKVKRIIYDGTQLVSLLQDVGISPSQLESFASLSSELKSAIVQLDIAYKNKERLLNQPKKPLSNGSSDEPPDDDIKSQFKRKYAAYSADLVDFQKQLETTTSSTYKLKDALKEKLATLDETNEEHLRQKQLIESLLVTTDKQILSQGKLREEINGQIADLRKLYDATNSKETWSKGYEELQKNAAGIEQTSQKVEIAMRNALGIQSKYNKEQTKSNTKAEADAKRLNDVLAIQRLTYEELVQLFNELTAARAKANTKEELNAIDAKLTEVRKNIELTSRQTQLSGAQIIGSQTSLQGVFASTLRLWQRGTLTLKGLTQGMKMFAKSTIFLAAIQLAWEFLTKVWEKAKEALFGTADAAEKAAEKQRELAAAAKEASVNLLAAQDALYEARREAERKAAAEEFKRQLRAQNDEYERQIKLVDDATAAQLRQMAITAKDDERQLALDKLLLQQELMSGKITEYEYQERLIRLEYETQQKKLEAATKQKKIALDAAVGQEQAAKRNKELAEKVSMKDMAGFEMSEVRVAELVTEYNERKRKVDKLTPKYAHLPKKREKLQRFVDKFKDYKDPRVQRMVKEKEEDLVDVERRIKELDDERNAMNEVFNLIPELVRKIGLNEFGVRVYSNEKSGRESYNASVQAEIDKTTKTLEKAEKATQKAEKAYQEAAEDNADAAIHAAKVSQTRIDMTRFNEQEAAKNKANEKKIQAVRDKVNSMEYAALKAKEKELLAQVAAAGENTPEGKRLTKVAAVYAGERQRRDTESRKAREKVELAGRDATGEAARIVDNAAKLAGKSVRGGAVDLVALAQLVKQAAETKSLADDAALKQTLKTVESLITTTQASSQKMRNLEKQVARLNRKTAAQL